VRLSGFTRSPAWISPSLRMSWCSPFQSPAPIGTGKSPQYGGGVVYLASADESSLCRKARRSRTGQGTRIMISASALRRIDSAGDKSRTKGD